MKLIRSLFAYINAVIYFLYFTLSLPFYLILKLIGLEEAFLRFNFFIMRIAVKTTLFLGGIKFIVTGKENIPNTKKIVIMANHIAAMDPIFFIYSFPMPFVIISKSSLLRVPIINFMLISMGTLFVNRRSIKSSAKVSKKAIEIVGSGRAIGIFPEGTRNRGGLTKDFKKGAIKIALQTNALVVPVTLLNTNKFFTKNFMFNSGTSIYMHIHKPIDVETLAETDKNTLNIRVRDQIVKKLDQMKNDYNII